MQVLWNDLYEPPTGLTLGIGVTAIDKADAKDMIKREFGELRIAGIRDIESIEQLEANHVRPNMGNYRKCGIWFPNISASFE